jgi:MFS family permease
VRVVRAAFVLAVFGWGVGFYGPPVFLHAVIERTGWPLPMVSAAVTLHYLGGVLVIAGLPRLHARWGVPNTIIAGAAVTSAGVWGWSIAAQPWQLFVAALLSGMGWVTMGAVAVNAVVSPWHVRTRPKALAKAYNGASIGGVVFSPLWVALIAWCGFAGAAAVVGVVMIVVMALLGQQVFARTPEGMGQWPDGDSTAPPARHAPDPQRTPLPGALLWRDRAFLTLASGMAIGLFAQIGLLAHLFSLLTPALGAQRAGLVMGGATACAIVGRSAATRLLLRIGDRRVVAAAGYATQALGSLALLMTDPGQTGMILLGVALFGSGIGNATSLPPLIAQTDFAPDDVARVVALSVAMGQATYAFAPALFGALLAASGPAGGFGIGARSVGVFAVAACIQLAAGAAFLCGRRAR